MGNIDTRKARSYDRERLEGCAVKFGYVRVSSEDQNLARQIAVMTRYGVEERFIFSDKLSGRNAERPGLKLLLSFVQEGDTVYIESISRLARNTRDLLSIIEELNKRGVSLVSDKETLDTSNPYGQFMLTIFGAMAQLERDTILERQREGIEIAKKEGRMTGRPKVVYDEKAFTEAYGQYKRGQITAKGMMNSLGLKEATFFRRLREYEKQFGVSQ